MIRIILIAITLAFSVSFAISAIPVHHDHGSLDKTDHRAPLDKNGCHPGPSGFHCH